MILQLPEKISMIKLLMEELKKLWKMGRDLKQPWQMIRLLHLGHQPNPMTTQVLISTYPKAILTVI